MSSVSVRMPPARNRAPARPMPPDVVVPVPKETRSTGGRLSAAVRSVLRGMALLLIVGIALTFVLSALVPVLAVTLALVLPALLPVLVVATAFLATQELEGTRPKGNGG